MCEDNDFNLFSFVTDDKEICSQSDIKHIAFFWSKKHLTTVQRLKNVESLLLEFTSLYNTVIISYDEDAMFVCFEVYFCCVHLYLSR